MNPDLVCKILVSRDESAQSVRGTGYPIARDRIVTAAHVLRAALKIRVTFANGDDPLITEDAIEVIWDGSKSEPKIDVAILRCKLPEEYQPTDLTLLRHRSKSPVSWQAMGYSRLAKSRRPDGLHDYSGPVFPKVTEQHTSKELTCNNGPKRQSGNDEAELWGGVSGSSVFEATGLQRMLAVTTDYLPGDHLPSLKVVPIPFLLTQPDFTEAISFEPDRQVRLDHLKSVRADLAKELTSLGTDVAELGKALTKLVDVDLSDMKPETVAEGILRSTDIPSLLGELCRLSRGRLKQHSRSLAKFAQIALPLNYLVACEATKKPLISSKGKLWFVEGAAKTATLAEIIMAGFDGAATEFTSDYVRGHSGQLQSPVAFDFSKDPLPESGPDAAFENVYNLLRQLLNESGTSAAAGNLTNDEIQELRADLEMRKEEWGDRTTYCIVRLPADGPERTTHRNILDKAANLLNPTSGAPRLVFVEKVADGEKDQNEADSAEVDDEFKIQSYFRQLLLRAYSEDSP